MRAVALARWFRSSLLRAALAALGAAVVPVPATAADDPRIEAFFDACLTGFRVPAERAAAIRKAGFLPAADDAHPELAGLMKLARKEMAQAAEEKFGTAMAVFARGAGADALYVVTNEVDQPPDNDSFRIDLMGCRLYDFSATAPLDGAPIARRLVQPAAKTVEEPGKLYTQSWASGVREGIWELSHSFVAEGTPESEKTGFSGVFLQVTSTKQVAPTQQVNPAAAK